MDRNNIINSYNKNQFEDFLKFDRSGRIFELFNDEGIAILKNNPDKEDKICYILSFSPYKNELLRKNNFLDMFLNSKISYYYAVLHTLDFKTYDTILNRAIELNKEPEIIAQLFSYFDNAYKLQKIDNWNYSIELLYNILKSDEPNVVQKIINNFDIDLLSHNINLENLFSLAKNSVLDAQAKRNVDNIIIDEIKIPSRMITKEMAIKLWNEYDIFAIRAIINDAEYCTDVSLLNDYIKNKEDNLITNYDATKLLSPFQEIFDAFKNYKLEELRLEKNITNDYDNYYNYKREFIRYLNILGDTNLYYKFDNLFKENGFEPILDYLNNLSNNSLSNYIIDYHFQENYHNIMLDTRELLNFYYNGNIAIPSERVYLYDKISNIDYLSYEEKIELHNTLKNYNMIETFYDDMALARYIVAEAIKEYSLSNQSIKQYKDEKLSKEYGVDVYNLNGEPFFGIVKTGGHSKDHLPTGHSYSLIGKGGIAVFGDPKNSNTYLYDSYDLNPNQIVHAFPFDSFTYYHPFEHSPNATRKVNTLLMPDELVETSISYNELLILEKGTKQTDFDKDIPELKRIALFCIDEIRKQDIENAKNNQVGILLINSSKYEKINNDSLSKYHHNINGFEYDYFDGIFEKDKFEAKR